MRSTGASTATSPEIPGCRWGNISSPYRENGRGVYTFCMCGTGCLPPRRGVVTNGMSEASGRQKRQVRRWFRWTAATSAMTGTAASTSSGSWNSRPSLLAGAATGRGPDSGTVFVREAGAYFGRVLPTYAIGTEAGGLRPSVYRRRSSMLRARGWRTLPGSSRPMRRQTRCSPPPRPGPPRRVRIPRGDDFQAAGLRGLYPCGEGAGYAGGIMSAAVDGIRCAEPSSGNMSPSRNSDEKRAFRFSGGLFWTMVRRGRFQWGCRGVGSVPPAPGFSARQWRCCHWGESR